MNSLIILRGLPGSGKSTLAEQLSESGKYPVYSIDDYFTTEKGEYNFEFDKNHLAYKSCENRVRESMRRNVSKIFVDNVFSIEWEIEPYFKLAQEFNYKVFVLTVENRHHGRNVHDISEDQIKRMAEKYRVVLF